MKFLDYTYYFSIFIKDFQNDFIKINIDKGIIGVLDSEKYYLSELYFDKDTFSSLDNVKKYWLSHQIIISDSKLKNISKEIKPHCYLTILKKETLPLLKSFILESSNDLKDILSKISQRTYTDEEYVEFYEYFKSYYNSDYETLSILYSDYNTFPEHLKFLEKAENKYFTSVYKDRYKKLSFVKKQIINKIFDFLKTNKANIYTTFDDKDMRSVINNDYDYIYAQIIKLAIKGGNMLIQIKKENGDDFYCIINDQKIYSPDSDMCKILSYKWFPVISYHSPCSFHHLNILS